MSHCFLTPELSRHLSRRTFLLSAGLASSALLVRPACGELLKLESIAGGWRVFEVHTSIRVLKPEGRTVVWIPEPLVEHTSYQRTISRSVDCPGGVVRFQRNRAPSLGVVTAQFPAGAEPAVKLTWTVATRDRGAQAGPKEHNDGHHPERLPPFLEPTSYAPLDGIVLDKAGEITKGAASDWDKARVIYDWIVDNTYRDPKVRGCGSGNIRGMLLTGDLGGKCADLNGLFVALARASGVPARDVYGIRLAATRMDCKSLGTSSPNVTKAQHCRAEFYSREHGWVAVDPADVRKVMLEEAPGHLAANDPKVLGARHRLFGGWEMNWMAFNYAQDVHLPGSQFGPIPFFMYPAAETAAGRIDSLDPENFQYEMTSRETTASGRL